MKETAFLLLMIGILNLICNDKINDTPIFEYDCVDTTFHYDSSNILTHRNIRYAKNNLFVRSFDLDGNVKYINYDSKSRIIKEGNISEDGHYFTEYIYGAHDTISEVRYSDNRSYKHWYNNERKIIETEYYENNLLINKSLFSYAYFTDVEMVKWIFDSEYVAYNFYIHNNADVPISIDTIKNYSLRYMTNNRLDSLLIFKNNSLVTRSLNIYNSFNELTYSEYLEYSTDHYSKRTRKWEYSLTNKVTRYIEEHEKSFIPNYYYYFESRSYYNELDEVVKNEIYSAQGVRYLYIIVSRIGLNTFYHWYDANDVFVRYSKYTPKCLDYIKSIFSFEAINETESFEGDYKKFGFQERHLIRTNP
jgi:hypothetical protein